MSIDSYTHEHTGTCGGCGCKCWISDDHGELCSECYYAENPEEDPDYDPTHGELI